MPSLAFRPTPKLPENLKPVFTAAVKALERGLTDPARITLVLPGMSKPSAVRRSLAGRYSPMGEIVADGDGNTQLVAFKCLDLLAWMAARGFLNVATAAKPV